MMCAKQTQKTFGINKNEPLSLQPAFEKQSNQLLKIRQKKFRKSQNKFAGLSNKFTFATRNKIKGFEIKKDL